MCAITRRLFWAATLLVLPALLFGQESSRRRKKGEEPRVHWSAQTTFDERGAELLTALEQRASVAGFSLLLDRRVDPQTPVTFTASEVTLFEGLTGLVESCGLSLALFDSLLYVGPKEAAGELLLLGELREQSRFLTQNKGAERLTVSVPLRMPEFSEPKKTLEELAKKAKWEWEGLDKMPFDCWRAVDLPPTPIETLLSLLLIGFNVDYQLDDKRPTLRPVAIKRDEPVSRTYAPEDAARIARSDFPGCQWSEVAGTLRVDGPLREVARVEYAIAKARMKALAAEEEERRAALAQNAPEEAQNPEKLLLSGSFRQVELSTVLKNLAQNFRSDFTLDASLETVGISPETRVSCTFDRVNRKKAAKILAETLGVSVRVESDRTVFYYDGGVSKPLL